jgi:Flp pilus assembly pilin Flp
MTPAGNGGQSLAEFGIILALMALVVIVALLFFGGQVSNQFGGVGRSV